MVSRVHQLILVWTKHITYNEHIRCPAMCLPHASFVDAGAGAGADARHVQVPKCSTELTTLMHTLGYQQYSAALAHADVCFMADSVLTVWQLRGPHYCALGQFANYIGEAFCMFILVLFCSPLQFCIAHCCTPPPPCISHALVQATVGVGTVIIPYIGVAYTRARGVCSCLAFCGIVSAFDVPCSLLLVSWQTGFEKDWSSSTLGFWSAGLCYGLQSQSPTDPHLCACGGMDCNPRVQGSPGCFQKHQNE